MTNEKLIKALRVEPFEVESIGLARIMNDAADALEAAEKRIAELEEDIIYWKTYAAEIER